MSGPLVPVAAAQSLDAEVSGLAARLAEQLVPRQKAKVVVIDLSDLQGRMSELGRYLADQLTIELVMQRGVTVVDRANLRAVMAEHRLTAEGLIDPENAKKLGKFIGVDALIVGTLSTMDRSVMASVRAVATETAELVAAGRMRFDLTDDARRMLGMAVAGGGTASGLAPPLSTPAAPPVAAVSVGPLVVSVKDVRTRREGRNSIPVVEVIMVIANPRLDAPVAVALNGQTLEDQTFSWSKTLRPGMLRGQLTGADSAWSLGPESVRGLGVLSGFDSIGKMQGAWVAPAEPANVVSYVRRGEEFAGGELPRSTQRMWAGSFSRVDPGAQIEVTATFTPSSGWRQQRDSVRFMEPSGGAFARTAFPSTVSLSLELLLATITGDEPPQKASSLALRNVTIVNIPLPGAK